MLCIKCGSSKHMAGNCPYKSSLCRNCKEMGHKATHCPRRPVQPRYCTEIYHKSISISAILATSIEITMMSKKVFDKIKGNPENSYVTEQLPPQTLTLHNKKIYSEGCYTAPFSFHGERTKFNINFHVIDDKHLPHEMMIGTDTMDNLKITFNMGKIKNAPEYMLCNINQNEDMIIIKHDFGWFITA